MKMRKNEPEIIIQYGRLIDPVFTFYCKNNPELKIRGWNNWNPPSKEDVDKKIEAYKKEWGKYNFVKNISHCLDLSFNRNVIDVFIVSGVPRSSSHPIIIKSSFKPGEFVVTLAHELIHRILTINKVPVIIFEEKESLTTNKHVIVFAVLKKILEKSLWQIVIKKASEHSTNEYERSINLVNKISPNEVIKMVKASLKSRL